MSGDFSLQSQIDEAWRILARNHELSTQIDRKCGLILAISLYLIATMVSVIAARVLTNHESLLLYFFAGVAFLFLAIASFRALLGLRQSNASGTLQLTIGHPLRPDLPRTIINPDGTGAPTRQSFYDRFSEATKDPEAYLQDLCYQISGVGGETIRKSEHFERSTFYFLVGLVFVLVAQVIQSF
jgi:hypothetical protein